MKCPQTGLDSNRMTEITETKQLRLQTGLEAYLIGLAFFGPHFSFAGSKEMDK